MPITYTIRAEQPSAHRAEVLLELPPLPGGSVELLLPSWVPGSYHILDYAKHVDALTAVDSETRAPLPVERVDKARWRIATERARAVEVRYSVYGHALVTEGFDVTPDHLFVNAALGLPCVVGHEGDPYEVILVVPPEWKVVTELTSVGLHPPRFRAADYDELVDNPIDCGRIEELTFSAGGVAHRVSLCGPGGNHEPHRLQSDLTRIVEATARLFGRLPQPHFTFFFHLAEVSDGGLEHANSTSLVVPMTAFRPESRYQRVLWVSSHEYFHLINVKRIRPAVFTPFDYSREVYTRLLWAMEGTTDYYGLLLLRRAGLLTPAQMLEKLAGEAKRYLGIPGRRRRSLEEASLLSWIDLYQANEESRNRSVSYYLKGLLVSWALDLEIRSRTENRASLDSAWRALWERFGARNVGVGETDLLPALSEAVGVDLAPFFARYVSGTDELDLAATARQAGLDFVAPPRTPKANDDGLPGWLGVEHETREGRLRLTFVADDSPARRAGLSPGDEIVAIDRNRVLPGDFTKELAASPPGTPVELTVFRRGRLTFVPVTTGTPPPESYEFVARADVTPLQKAIYESWLEATWEPPKRPDSAAPGAGH